jgi:uncharacterized cupin superfamily protein
VSLSGAAIFILLTPFRAGGAFTVFEGQTQPLAASPLHRHSDQDEWWYILDGEYQVRSGLAGDTRSDGRYRVRTPVGSRHTFQNIGAEPGRKLTAVIQGR